MLQQEKISFQKSGISGPSVFPDSLTFRQVSFSHKIADPLHFSIPKFESDEDPFFRSAIQKNNSKFREFRNPEF